MADLLLYLGLFMVMFSIISMDFFQLEPAHAGYLMSFFGILQMVSRHEQKGLGFPAYHTLGDLPEGPSWLPP